MIHNHTWRVIIIDGDVWTDGHDQAMVECAGCPARSSADVDDMINNPFGWPVTDARTMS